MTTEIERIRKAFRDDDAVTVAQILNQNPDLKARINEPVGDFGTMAITCAKSPKMLDVLLEAGADINAKSDWWAGGFGILHLAEPNLAKHAIQKGAKVDAHAAARLGLIDELQELIRQDPAVVHARGGDGQTPLHFASTVEIAALLLGHGADIDAKDVDHESTPAQYMVRSRPEVAKFLIAKGCKTDILMAAALGESELVKEHLDRDPASIRTRVSSEYFPMIGGKSGGTIYQWELGWYVSAYQIAQERENVALMKLLMERSPIDVKLVNACWSGDEALVAEILASHPNLISTLSQADRKQLAHAARNNDEKAVRLMLKAGWPVDETTQHEGTALHWAGFLGNSSMTRALLAHNAPLDTLDRDFKGTPLGWAIHGSAHGWAADRGDFAGTVEAMLDAGAPLPDELGGSEAVRAVLRARGVQGKE